MPTPEPIDLARFLEDTIEIDWQSPQIQSLAAGLTRDLDAPIDRVRALFEWVRDEIPHSFDIETDVVTCRASDVLRQATGLCFAKSHLLAALLRARGIPAGFGYQRLRKEFPDTGFELHGFCGLYLGDEDRWVVADPSGRAELPRTPLRVDPPAFACEVDAERGEETCPTLFARPSRRVLDVLDRIDSLAVARKHLPSEW